MKNFTPAIIIGILGFVAFMYLGNTSPEKASSYDEYDLLDQIAKQEKCINALQRNMYEVRGLLQEYGRGATYDELYYTIYESERTLDPEPYEC